MVQQAVEETGNVIGFLIVLIVIVVILIALNSLVFKFDIGSITNSIGQQWFGWKK